MTLINKLKTKYRTTVGYIRVRSRYTEIRKIVLETKSEECLGDIHGKKRIVKVMKR